MPRALALAVLLLLTVGRSPVAAEDASPGPQASRPPAPPPGAPAAPPEPLAIPFAHRAGERWRLIVGREVQDGGRLLESETLEARVEVLSPLRRGWLVEVRATSLSAGGRVLPLEPRRAESAARLDALGGGRLLLDVDRSGSATQLLNDDEVRAALGRAAGAALGPERWQEARGRLLEGWNVVYRGCGVALVEGQVTETALDGAGLPGGRDVRVLRRGPGGRVLSLEALTTYDPPGEAASVHETFVARYDPVERRLSGRQDRERRTPVGRSLERLSFLEAPEAVAAPPLAAR